MHFNQLFLVVFAAMTTFTSAYEDEVNEAIKAGRDRLAKIPAVAGHIDSRISCNLDQCGVEMYDPEESPETVSDVVKTAKLPLKAAWSAVSHRWSASLDLDKATKRFQCNYNPDGAIVHSDIERRENDGSPYFAADVSWTTYKSVCMDAIPKVDEETGENRIIAPSKKRYLIHTDVTDADEVFEAFASDENVVTFTDEKSDGFLAFLGLNNGATVSSLPSFHNQELGGKKIRSVSAWQQGSLPILMWELQ